MTDPQAREKLGTIESYYAAHGRDDIASGEVWPTDDEEALRMATRLDARRFVRVTFPDPAPGTWPADAEFRDRWEGHAGVIVVDEVIDARLGLCVMVRFEAEGVELFRPNELTRVCGECGHALDDSTMRCAWPYCPTLP